MRMLRRNSIAGLAVLGEISPLISSFPIHLWRRGYGKMGAVLGLGYRDRGWGGGNKLGWVRVLALIFRRKEGSEVYLVVMWTDDGAEEIGVQLFISVETRALVNDDVVFHRLQEKLRKSKRKLTDLDLCFPEKWGIKIQRQQGGCLNNLPMCVLGSISP